MEMENGRRDSLARTACACGESAIEPFTRVKTRMILMSSYNLFFDRIRPHRTSWMSANDGLASGRQQPFWHRCLARTWEHRARHSTIVRRETKRPNCDCTRRHADLPCGRWITTCTANCVQSRWPPIVCRWYSITWDRPRSRSVNRRLEHR